jgi:hypothetical protein
MALTFRRLRHAATWRSARPAPSPPCETWSRARGGRGRPTRAPADSSVVLSAPAPMVWRQDLSATAAHPSVGRCLVTVNRYAAGCFSCSLDVLPGGGRLRPVEGAWHVVCLNCYERHRASSRGDEPPPLPPGSPPGCRPSISLRVLGIYRECWRCKEMTLCVGALYPDRHATDSYSLITCGGGEPLEVARTILQSGGRNDLSKTIRPRYSKTVSGTYVSNGC